MFSVQCYVQSKEKEPGMSTSTSKGCPHHRLAGCFTVLTVYRESNPSDPAGLLTLFLVALKQHNTDSSLYITLLQSSSVQCLYFWQKQVFLPSSAWWGEACGQPFLSAVSASPPGAWCVTTIQLRLPSPFLSCCQQLRQDFPLQYLESMLGDQSRATRALFPCRNGAWRQRCGLREESLNWWPMVAQAVGDSGRHFLL